jgi:hypothetical protein
MDLAQIFHSLLDKPNVPKFYRELRLYYLEKNMLHEASAIGFLLENKFGKNNEKPAGDTPIDQEQFSNN